MWYIAAIVIAVVASAVAYAVTAWCIAGRPVLPATYESRRTWRV